MKRERKRKLERERKRELKRKYNPRSGFQNGHPFYRSSKPGAYSVKRPRKADYEPVAYEDIPADVQWKPAPPHTGPKRAYLSMFGGMYYLERVLDTGAVRYFKRKGEAPPESPAAVIDAEPERPKQQRFHAGTQCWYIHHTGHWFLCEIVDRIGGDRESFGEPRRIIIKPLSDRDDKREIEWPFPKELEIVVNSPAFKRLRKLQDRIA